MIGTESFRGLFEVLHKELVLPKPVGFILPPPPSCHVHKIFPQLIRYYTHPPLLHAHVLIFIPIHYFYQSFTPVIYLTLQISFFIRSSSSRRKNKNKMGKVVDTSLNNQIKSYRILNWMIWWAFSSMVSSVISL
jgi:hypothetical protein